MGLVVCPHCGNRRIVAAEVPKDAVAVLQCPACHGLVVQFRKRTIAVKREILEGGSREDRVRHCAEIITEFLEAGLLNGLFAGLAEATGDPFSDDQVDPEADTAAKPRRHAHRNLTHGALISQEEFDTFVKVELNRLDEPAYFRKLFGN